ncbi:MAG: CHAP domain-containing protein, partial [Lachnospiraceae bacterium]|nr:CHAP domain-containing protein [Lachnospiraceae bacterium]
MAIIMLLTLLPIENAYAATAKEIQEFCNGTDFFVAEDGTEYFINSDDEDKLYRITQTGAELVLDEHIVLLVCLNTNAYLVAYRDTKCVLLKFDTKNMSYEKIYDFECSVSNIALKGNNLYFINNGIAQALNLENFTVKNVSEKSVDTLYFDQSATLKLIENTCVPSDFSGSKDESAQRSASKNVTSYTPRLTAPAKDNPYYTTLNIFHNSGYGMAPNIGNCTCYAFGRSYENLGAEPKLSHGNAGEWYDYNKKYGYYSYGATPTLGAVCVWKSGGAGHVAVVEVIDGNTVTTSESGWASYYFKTVTRNASNSNLSASSYYSFQGFIYVLGQNAATTPAKAEDPLANLPDGTYTLGARENRGYKVGIESG